MRIEELRNFVREVIKEAVADGVFQSRARKSYARMIKTVGTGGKKCKVCSAVIWRVR